MKKNNSLDTESGSCPNISLIFNKWSELRMKSGSIRQPKLTKKREQRFALAIRDYGIEEVLLVLDFLLSDDKYACWMRINKYTTIENIFNSKFFDKIKRAENYFDNLPEIEEKHEFFTPFSIVDEPR